MRWADARLDEKFQTVSDVGVSVCGIPIETKVAITEFKIPGAKYFEKEV